MEPRVTKDNLRVYLATKKADERSHIEDTMVLDGIEVRTFGSASDLWPAFQEKPARLIISDRRFIDSFSGLDLAQQIRKHHMLPYVYVDARLAREWAKGFPLDGIVSTDGDSDRPLLADEHGEWLRGDILGIVAAKFVGADSVSTPISSNTAVEKAGWFKRVIRTASVRPT